MQNIVATPKMEDFPIFMFSLHICNYDPKMIFLLSDVNRSGISVICAICFSNTITHSERIKIRKMMKCVFDFISDKEIAFEIHLKLLQYHICTYAQIKQ